jgi:hypothetical protein
LKYWSVPPAGCRGYNRGGSRMKTAGFVLLAAALNAQTVTQQKPSTPPQPKYIDVGRLQVAVDMDLASYFPAYLGEGPALVGPVAKPGEGLDESFTIQTDDGKVITYTGGWAAASPENVLARLRVRIRNNGDDDRLQFGDVQLECGTRRAEVMAVGRGGHPFVKRGAWMDKAKTETARLSKGTASMYTYIFVVPRGSGECRARFRNQTLATLSAPGK